jgi:hypothetical protein
MVPQAEPGWYTDDQTGTVRWWDGNAWSQPQAAADRQRSAVEFHRSRQEGSGVGGWGIVGVIMLLVLVVVVILATNQQ